MATTEVRPRTTVGERLEAARHKQQLSKEEWCERLQVSKPTYLTWLSRSVDIEFQNIQRIADELDVSISEVFDWMTTDRAKGVYRGTIPALAA